MRNPMGAFDALAVRYGVAPDDLEGIELLVERCRQAFTEEQFESIGEILLLASEHPEFDFEAAIKSLPDLDTEDSGNEEKNVTVAVVMCA